LFGFLWSHVGWIVSDKYEDTRESYIADFAKFPELRWLNKYHVVPSATLGVALCLIGGWPLFVWGFCMSTVLLWHDTFSECGPDYLITRADKMAVAGSVGLREN
jgi:stearoyl-CoA desaturase (Delta-9 desaturase)